MDANQQIIDKAHELLEVGDETHLPPNIPFDKLLKHMKSYVYKFVPSIQPNEVLFFHDMGMGMGGIILTSQYIFSKDIGSGRQCTPLQQVQLVKTKKGLVNHDIFINGKKIAETSCGWDATESIGKFLNAAADILKHTNAVPPLQQDEGEAAVISATQSPKAMSRSVSLSHSTGNVPESGPVNHQQIPSAAPHVQSGVPHAYAGTSSKNKWVALALCTALYFTGLGGLHRIYAGKIGTGVLQLLTLGGFFIWQFIDWIIILSGNFEDGDDLTRT